MRVLTEGLAFLLATPTEEAKERSLWLIACGSGLGELRGTIRDAIGQEGEGQRGLER